MKGNVNNHMIVLAREARRLNQNELAERIQMSATNLSKIERGDIGISEEILEAISEITSYPKHFFQQDGGIVPEMLAYRKRQKVAQRFIVPINAQANIIRRHVHFLTTSLNIAPPLLCPFEVREQDSAAQIAFRLRKKWNLPRGPIENLGRLLEDKGIVVVNFDFGTERVDSRGLLTDDGHPIVFLNRKLLGDRQRFSLAYELGQLLMHGYWDLSLQHDIVHEANAFAAEFLLPARDIKEDFSKGISIALLGQLKKKWKVSMISLLYRADDLGFLTPNQRRYLLQQFNQLRIRRREPVELDIAVEKHGLMKKWIAAYRLKHGLGAREMAALFCLNPDEFLELYS
jgi:Zn-dependent peptidase ImmA (M78 family)/transcriptional regulator with XRE-family HTH domain